MIGRRMISVCAGAFFGIFLIGQDCVAQQCDPDPCVSIPNAVAGTCTEIGGPCVGPSDFSCSCDLEYTWQPGTHTCQGSSSGLPDTGITQCYDNWAAIECPAPGEPFYGQDAQYVTNSMSYTVSPDGLSATDNVTGLVWQRCSSGLSGADCSIGTVQAMSWWDAIACCEDLSLAGYMNWRLPNEYELQRIVDYGRGNPAINPAVFPGTAVMYNYWSSSNYAYYDNYGAWNVNFYEGYLYAGMKTDTEHYVRCVLGEEVLRSIEDNGDGTVTDNVTGLMWQKQDDNITRNWEASLAYCEQLELAGHSDWRLPNIRELRSIVDNTRYDPAIDTTTFPGTKSNDYWSSSTLAQYPHQGAWMVGFDKGHTGGNVKTYPYYVRCVR